MTKDEAIEECQRYLAFLDERRKRALEFQALATMARNGEAEKAQRRVRELDKSPVVYDAANLEKAIGKLLQLVK